MSQSGFYHFYLFLLFVIKAPSSYEQQQVAAVTLFTKREHEGKGLHNTNVDSKTLLRPLDDVDMEEKSSA
ncbi:hypothetical protein MKW92_000807 [Papaver armeniacum]|nr:hypothetical protein MKW92_000807 [Papaver armeniacum]